MSNPISNKKNGYLFDAIIYRLYSVKTDNDLFEIMMTLVSSVGEVIINDISANKSKDTALAFISIFKIYFEVVSECKSNDAGIIAYNIAEQLEILGKDYSAFHKKRQQQRASEGKS